MRRSILLCSLPALLLLGCPQPPENGGFSSIPDPGEVPCTNGTGSIRILNQGLFEAANWQECEERQPSGGSPAFTGHSGTTTLVAGGSTELTLTYDGFPDGFVDATVIAKVEEESDLAVLPLAPGADDQPGEVTVEIYTRANAPGGAFVLLLGFDDGTGTASNPQPVAWYPIEFEIVATLGGDLQFALNWDQENDVDLHVIDPDGERVFYANPASESGGVLDLDSNAGCAIDGVRNENIIWEAEAAPAGAYQVYVNLWSACDVSVVTNWRLTILERGVPVQTVEGQLSPVDANPDGEPANIAVSYEFGG